MAKVKSEPGETIQLVSKTGVKVTVLKSDAEALLKSGYKAAGGRVAGKPPVEK